MCTTISGGIKCTEFDKKRVKKPEIRGIVAVVKDAL